MYETNTASDGVGLAAPQIGKSIRVVIIDLTPLSDEFPEYKDFRHAFINGHILEFDDSETETLEEGCLSLPGIHEPVSALSVFTPSGSTRIFRNMTSGSMAIWLVSCSMSSTISEGKMFIDHLSPFRKQMIRSKLKALSAGKVRCGYRVKPYKK